MAVKIYDTMTTASDGFPLAYAEKINVKRQDGSEDNLQNLFNNGELSGGGSGTSYIELSEEEYFALSDEQRASEVEYRTYDTGRIFKRGVEYGKDGVQISDNETVEDKTWSSKKTSDEIAKVETELGEKVDYKVVVEDGGRYVEDIVVQDINTWLPNDNSSILINLKKTNGINYLNFQLLCNKKDSKNWSCIVNGAANELWKIRYIDGVRYIDELATMDKVGDNIIVTPHTQIGATYTIIPNDLNRIDIDVTKSGYTCIGLLSLQDNHGSYTQFRGWYVEDNKVVVHVISGEPYNDYKILASLLYKKN